MEYRALDEVQAKLQAGVRVADVGCGFGASTMIMAEASPKSTFIGFDYHPLSVETARKSLQQSKRNGQVRFEVALATEYPGTDYDFATFFDCLHDMSVPTAVARHVRETLKPDGTWLIVEPYAGDRMQDNLTQLGRVYSAASTLISVTLPGTGMGIEMLPRLRHSDEGLGRREPPAEPAVR